jgi:endonuclease/exonuclease/phosphatase family metal-dependent hydrolase
MMTRGRVLAKTQRHKSPRSVGLKLATFNINNVRRRLPNLLAWLVQSKPDIVCLQELKAADAELPACAIEAAGYNAVWKGEKTWNGVAILSRVASHWLHKHPCPGTLPTGRAATLKRRSLASLSAASMHRTVIRSPAQNSNINSPGSRASGATLPN